MLEHVVDDLLWLGEHAREPIIRSMRSFAEGSIIIPDGPFAGQRFKCERQPYSAAYFAGVDSGLWNRNAAVGPTQSGKTLTAWVIPINWHLFEWRENVVAGLPSMDISGDKWTQDIKPVIEASEYREYLPKTGAGSRDGGNPTLIKFRNGTVLKFMSGGGSDKKRSAFTSRVLAVTEVDGLDESGEASKEADKIKQMIGRTRAYGSRARIYLECTASYKTGRIWRELCAGTNSRLHIPCPKCHVYVAPEREHLHGWQDTENVVEARSGAFFACPSCGKRWSDADREASVQAGVLLHSGQTIIRGPRGKVNVIGDAKPTDTFSMRWSAFENLFLTPGDIGVDEWKATQDEDEDNAEKEMLQFVWGKPYVPPKIDLSPLDRKVIARRSDKYPQGVVPPGTTQLTIGVDVGKFICHWVLFGWRQDDQVGNIIDYGKIEVPSKDMDEKRALVLALRDFWELAQMGWALGADMRVSMNVQQMWIDSGYMPECVYKVVKDAPRVIRPTKGHSMIHKLGRYRTAYKAVSKKTELTRKVGEAYHISKLKAKGVRLVHIDADYWKMWVHHRFTTPLLDDEGVAIPDPIGSVQLYEVRETEATKASKKNHHMDYAASLTSEKMEEEHIPGKGPVTRWVVTQRNKNHFLDATALAMAAAHCAGARLLDKAPAKRPPAPPPPAEDGDDWLDGVRRGRR